MGGGGKECIMIMYEETHFISTVKTYELKDFVIYSKSGITQKEKIFSKCTRISRDTDELNSFRIQIFKTKFMQ